MGTINIIQNNLETQLKLFSFLLLDLFEFNPKSRTFKISFDVEIYQVDSPLGL